MPATRTTSDPRPAAAGTGPRTVVRDLMTQALPSMGAPFLAADRARLFRILVDVLDMYYGEVDPDTVMGETRVQLQQAG